jgi:hypothetical protein
MQLSCFETKLPNLMLKTLPKQLLGSLPLDIALPAETHQNYFRLGNETRPFFYSAVLNNLSIKRLHLFQYLYPKLQLAFRLRLVSQTVISYNRNLM